MLSSFVNFGRYLLQSIGLAGQIIAPSNILATDQLSSINDPASMSINQDSNSNNGTTNLYERLSKSGEWAANPYAKNDPEFVILVTSYNNERFAVANAKSVCHQKSTKPYHVIIVNDCSKDKTGQILDNYKRENHLDDALLTIIHNPVRMGALENIYNSIHHFIPDNKIVVSVDGDDELPDNDVLMALTQTYKKGDVWITYGNALSTPARQKMFTRVPDKVFQRKQIREYSFKTQHLRTFKAGLFKKIKKDDLLYKGKFYPMTWDMAIMFPMLEMASPKKSKYPVTHIAYNERLSYLYRMDNPISDFRVDRSFQKALDHEIRAKKPYQPIDSL